MAKTPTVLPADVNPNYVPPPKQHMTNRVSWIRAAAQIEAILAKQTPEMATLVLETVLKARNFAIRQLEVPFTPETQQ